METTMSDSSAKTAAPATGDKATRKLMPGAARESVRSHLAENFANVVAVLMRDPGFKGLRIADLEWLVLPPLIAGQWRLAQSRVQKPGTKENDAANSLMVPVGIALWARVSPEVDRRLSETLDKPLILTASEWTSGDIHWLIALAGDRKSMPAFVKQLETTVLAGKKVKLRANGPDGKVQIRTLGANKSQ